MAMERQVEETQIAKKQASGSGALTRQEEIDLAVERVRRQDLNPLEKKQFFALSLRGLAMRLVL